MKNAALRYSIITVLFIFFSLLQASFLPFFSILGQFPNVVFILFYLILFFDEEGEESFFFALVAGFLLDVFTPSYFGISMAALLIVYLFKKVLDYFLKNMQGKYFMVYFAALFSVNFVLYTVIIYISSLMFNFQFTIGLEFIIQLAYNIVLLLPGFYLYKFLAKPDYLENQLKLL